jgi:hypothetical protein
MARRRAGAKKFQCGACYQTFNKKVGLSLHLHHNRTSCGKSTGNVWVNDGTGKKPAASGAVRAEQMPALSNVPPAAYAVAAHDSSSNDEFLDGEVLLSHASDDSMSMDYGKVEGIDEVNEAAMKNNVAFELSEGVRASIPGEIEVVNHSVEQKVHVELLQLLDKVGAPDYMFSEIIDWASRAKSQNYTFCPVLTSRAAVFNDLKQHFNMQDLKPTVRELKLESIAKMVPVVSFEFKSQLVSLLTDVSLMQPENLVINDPTTNPDGSIADVSPCFLPYKAENNVLDEVLSGGWYEDTATKLYSLDSNVFVCPVILYVDKTFIDPKASRFNLEPVNFTLALFKRRCRYRFPYWRSLGYIPPLPDSDVFNAASGHKARNYHLLVESILSSLIEVHRNPSILDNFHLRIGNHVRKVNLRVPVAFVVSDTQGADKLCGRYLNYTDKVCRLHRSCVCPQGSAADYNHVCRFVTMEEMMEVIDNADKEQLRSYSQHCIPRHAFRQIDFGENPFGIYGAIPNDILHGIKLGIIPYVLEVYFKDNMTDSGRYHLDRALKATLSAFEARRLPQFPTHVFP